MAKAILVAVTTGLRRAELCVLRCRRDVDFERGLLRVSASIVNLPDQPLGEIPTKNRRVRRLAIDDLTAAILRAQINDVEQRAVLANVALVDDPYIFTDAADGSLTWKLDAVSPYFGRMRKRIGLDHLDFHYLRKFMETYGQEMGVSITLVAMRAGHDPSIAAKHYSGRGPRPTEHWQPQSPRCSPRPLSSRFRRRHQTQSRVTSKRASKSSTKS
jgi:integrase